ncbi:TIGR02186 family protein [Breoghania sp.]|uniref:TIGR02186 family protein n=1 Tax=Breoghania sp. TaxID=2065378 RepID=UPI002AAB9FF4|nr:TIGR02186 family protein [Breoghania sp.]
MTRLSSALKKAMTTAGVLLGGAVGFVLQAGDAKAETLVTALSEPAISITSNFTGADIVVFGTVERDAVTVERPDPYDIVVTVRGPKETTVTRRKGRVFGVWVNNDAVRFIDIPSFYALHATRPLEEIADTAVLNSRQIGAEYLPMRSDGSGQEDAQRIAEFRKALLRLKLQDGLYAERTDAVTFLSPSLFRTTVPLPANVPVGNYEVEVTLFRGGALLTSHSGSLKIGKAGFEQFTFELAHTNPVIYGLATVLMALATGWLAGVIFRRE